VNPSPLSPAKPSSGPQPYAIARLDAIEPQRCPCGWTRRAFASIEGAPATVHLVEIAEDSRPHYHRGMTEIYIVLEGEGSIELDGQRFALSPLTAILIQPGCRHRAIGKLKLLNIPIPAFDPADEWFD
jgi:mannose-6-phosphate isomerase-like protein (cupin superfamily)